MKTLLVDTNLLVLLVVGLSDPDMINKHKRTKGFDVEDFDQLVGIIKKFNKILVTPHILSETSNLLAYGQDPETFRNQLFEMFRKTMEEKIEESKDIMTHKEFPRLGLADSAILNQLIDKEVTLISTDLNLCVAAQKINDSAINFNHVRQGRLINS